MGRSRLDSSPKQTTTTSSTIPSLPPHPSNTASVSLRIPRHALNLSPSPNPSVSSKPSGRFSRPRTKKIAVEASDQRTNDSIFFAPERANATECHDRVTPTEFIKVRPGDHRDVVRIGDDFEIEFVGMSVAAHEVAGGGGGLLLCSFTRDDEAGGYRRNGTDEDRERTDIVKVLDDVRSNSTLHTMRDDVPTTVGYESLAAAAARIELLGRSDALGYLTSSRGMGVLGGVVDDLPGSLRLSKHDIPFIHYDPVLDGREAGTVGDSFVAVPGSKRLYMQRKGRYVKVNEDESPSLFLRFGVMEIDKLSEDQLAAVKSIDVIARNVGEAALAVSSLKFVSALLKTANYLGKNALRKLHNPDHVMAADILFKIAQREDENAADGGHSKLAEEYGNYLRYGYYFFLSKKVDAKLYAQTGSSSQAVSLLLKRKGGGSGGKAYVPLTAASYVVVKVTKGCSPLRHDRREIAEMHRQRLFRLFQKYKSAEGRERENGRAK